MMQFFQSLISISLNSEFQQKLIAKSRGKTLPSMDPSAKLSYISEQGYFIIYNADGK